ncbi:MAG: methyl-accepting chemotaxis protein [Devosia sp.]|nr:methyl-accepting chemotaxis protein [Devosia sp.]
MPSFAIRHRLTAVVLCSLLPIALLGYLFFAQSQKEIAFGAKEAAGTSYIQALMPELVALARQPATAAALPDSPALTQAMSTFDAAMNTTVYSRAYAELRAKLGDGRHPAAARHAAATLIARIGDGSNLILDPDLDSYYVMDLLVLKLPAAINSAPTLATQLTAARFTPELTNPELVALVANLGAFRATVAAAADALAAADAGNADGSVKRNLGRPLAAYLLAADRFGDAMEAASAALSEESPRAMLDLAPVQAAHLGFQQAAFECWQAVGAEMRRLLGIRLAGFESSLWTMLSISAGLVLTVLVSSWLPARSIVRGISRLEADIRALADGGDTKVAHAAGKDEISAIARAAAYLRDRTVERLTAAENLKTAEQRRADEARQAADAERQRNEAGRLGTLREQQHAVALLGEGLEKLADGDLSARIDMPFSGEMDKLRLALNGAVERFGPVIGQLRDTSRALKTATQELLAGANDLSDRTARQVATIEETGATMEALAATVLSNAERATAASSTAVEVTQAAEAGGAVMHKANEAMERITASSDKIASVIGVIDDIAFQTNLLALNASVEAARAGEAGKGFAVVAIEVRRLAQSAAEASKEIKVLIERSVGEVQGGSTLVAEAASRLAAMLEAARANNQLMETIAQECRGQACSIKEINVAVRQMDQMTQHNAALVEQTTAAIEQTEAQASDLDQIVELFKVGEAEQAGAGARIAA